MKIKALNGFKDILPEEVALWRTVESQARSILQLFNFAEIRLPVLEKTELFARSIGEATDIVEKEMYTFVDKQITMRPEATASLVRAYIQHGLYVKKPVQRLFTIGPMFRHERPQKGRLRQFHQISVEVLGSENGRIDAEMMALAALFFEELGVNVSLELNSLGCPECRPAFRRELLAFLQSKHDELCDDCRRRVDTNPLRVLDCKNVHCRELVEDAPSILEHLCEVCSDHFSVVRNSLEQLGIGYSLNKFMVRGLDYYCRTTFEFLTTDLGAQAAVCAGGRYDGLVEQLGGPKTPGIGFAMGLERLVLLLQQKGELDGEVPLDLFVAGLGEQGGEFAYTLTHQLRKRGLSVAMDHEGRSLKSQMKQADRSKASFVLLIGDEEVDNRAALLRNMKTREQMSVELRDEEIEAVVSSLLPLR
ncbi:histidine--tRNA ligase [Desulfopila inferna]|uniref:histidine--tRNA ligase n=1 Tax=Desulfopila inferna TaxID=468528 RepID=UPI0019664265|nr:histidine--tRNA ligase [Desulfopila inferna]MBM9606360.1 histidine--tRNA ligase [Desulfopila inferna]